MTNNTGKLKQFFSNPTNVYLIGLVLGMAATCIELARCRAENLVDFRDATQLFWQGITAYTPEYVKKSCRGCHYI